MIVNKRAISITMDDKRLAMALHYLTGGMQRKIVKPATKKAFKHVMKATKQNAPVETGLLKKSITIKQKIYPRAGTVWTGVGAKPIYGTVVRGTMTRRRWPTHYFHLVEFGTAPHNIRPKKRGDALAIWDPVEEANIHRSAVKHPGTKAKRFATRAFRSQKSVVKRTLQSEIRANLIKLAKKTWAKAGRG